MQQPFVGNRRCEFIMIFNDDNDRLAKRGWTSICCSNVQILGDNPRVHGVRNTGGTAQIAKKRRPDSSNPRITGSCYFC